MGEWPLVVSGAKFMAWICDSVKLLLQIKSHFETDMVYKYTKKQQIITINKKWAVKIFWVYVSHKNKYIFIF